MTGTRWFTFLLLCGPDLYLESRLGTNCNDGLSTSSWLDSSVSRESDSQHTYVKILLSSAVSLCRSLWWVNLSSQALIQLHAQFPAVGGGENWKDKSKKNSW